MALVVGVFLCGLAVGIIQDEGQVVLLDLASGATSEATPREEPPKGIACYDKLVADQQKANDAYSLETKLHAVRMLRPVPCMRLESLFPLL